MRAFLCRFVGVLLAVSGSSGAVFAGSAEPEQPRQEAPVKREPPPLTWRQAVVPGPSVTLRLKRPVGKSMIYQGTLDREQKAASSYHEIDSFYLNALCASQEDGRDMIAMLRTFLDRKRNEKLENGKTLERSLENSTELIDMGPNFNTVGTNLRCYAFDAQNRIAYRTVQMVTLKDGKYVHGNIIRQDDKRITIVTDEDKIDILLDRIAPNGIQDMPLPHVCINEAPHYMYPLLPERAVSPGDAWRFRVPTIIPLEHGLEAKALPTQFDVVFNGRLREVRDTPNGKTAIIDYQVSGAFDSSLPEFAPRFPPEFHAGTLIQHRFTGEGTAVIDVDHGWMLDRQENFDFFFFTKVAQENEKKYDKKGKLVTDKPRKPLETKMEVLSRFNLKLLMPGTRLKSGAIVQNYD